MSQSQKGCGTVIALITSEGCFLCYQPVKLSPQRRGALRREGISLGESGKRWPGAEWSLSSPQLPWVELSLLMKAT